MDPLKDLFIRDLRRLKVEIESYQDDANLWKIENSIKNSGGNLCLHLIGNLKTYIGNGLAAGNYIRQRDFEFAGKNVERSRLYQEIDETIEAVDRGFSKLNPDALPEYFPMQIWEKETGMEFTLLHLYGHLNYHLGQINYHRRILDGNQT